MRSVGGGGRDSGLELAWPSGTPILLRRIAIDAVMAVRFKRLQGSVVVGGRQIGLFTA